MIRRIVDKRGGVKLEIVLEDGRRVVSDLYYDTTYLIKPDGERKILVRASIRRIDESGAGWKPINEELAVSLEAAFSKFKKVPLGRPPPEELKQLMEVESICRWLLLKLDEHVNFEKWVENLISKGIERHGYGGIGVEIDVKNGVLHIGEYFAVSEHQYLESKSLGSEEVLKMIRESIEKHFNNLRKYLEESPWREVITKVIYHFRYKGRDMEETRKEEVIFEI
ncbi:MAG: hypothetical protein DRN15_04315 [Thermoprotei archaeon]|nr:MAG: hypothetical protein DRN15_04315 [Thermoprotei archaeon]RLF24632.1 MAG: hypothetical protein DRM97_03280 [Thermoprotei archaeon]